jgi:uncharacterized protein YbjT (DUF2867 family)
MTTKENLFLITGATGNTGTPTVKLLRDAGHRVRALVHDIDERSKSLEERGVEIAAGDFLDFDAVSSAMTGVTATYFCYPIPPGGLLQATTIFAQAASEARRARRGQHVADIGAPGSQEQRRTPALAGGATAGPDRHGDHPPAADVLFRMDQLVLATA